ncbi:hypothetical protein C2G38_2253174 [Gigaspora rosea]|uniref:Uncharacterized protein n=1 Tax=Gigaspora rosea TaxID=44941 RepID=A0A397U8K1_9GLOM|nr:hypothetical protein C2G38_2253174 [Gigaspora rosea]
MSSHGYNPPSSVCEVTLPEDSINEITLSNDSENNTIDPLLSEITAYFVDCGFQANLWLDSTIFIGIEGSSVNGIASGENKKLLVKWALQKKSQVNSVINNYERKGEPQMFAASYEDVATGINKFLSSNTKVADVNTKCSTYRAFFLTMNQQSTQAINFIKSRMEFNGIVVYWVNMGRKKSMKYRDLVLEGKNLWKRVEILSEWVNNGGDDVEGSWQNAIPNARWFEPIRHLQLAIKTCRAVNLMNSYCIGIIYFHTKP